jgi:hypothetical protein
MPNGADCPGQWRAAELQLDITKAFVTFAHSSGDRLLRMSLNAYVIQSRLTLERLRGGSPLFQIGIAAGSTAATYEITLHTLRPINRLNEIWCHFPISLFMFAWIRHHFGTLRRALKSQR